MKQVEISELEARLSEHLRSVQKGNVIEVIDRARPIARVVPLDQEDGLEVMPAARSFASVRRARVTPTRISMSTLEALRLDRGSR